MTTRNCPSPLYLSPTSAQQVIDNLDVFGFLQSPRTGLRSQIIDGAWWALDNDCFNNGGELDTEAWNSVLEVHLPYRNRCLFVLVPDVVADAQETLRRFEQYVPRLCAEDFPIAIATQNGMTPEMIPWSRIDAIFVGGDDYHKLGPEAGAIIAAAQRCGKWVHVGRVNSTYRLRKFQSADSWDGTTISRCPQNAVKIANAVREIRALRASGGFQWSM